MKKGILKVLGASALSLVACSAMAQVYDTGSNVGIGVVSPGFKLDVDGSLNLSVGNGINIDGNQIISANGPRNIFIGDGTGLNITSGQDNAIIGFKAGENLTTGTFNTLIGLKAGQNMTDELSNTIIGRFAGQNNTGDRNVFIGREAGISNAGLDNTFIGDRAGLSNVGGFSNTLIGKNADVGNDSLTNATAIGSGAVAGASNTVILGNGASVGVGTSTPGYDLEVVGDINFTGDLYENGVLFTGGSGATGPTGPSGSDGSDGATGATGPLVSGSTDETLRYSGGSWTSSSNLLNDGITVAIGTTPSNNSMLKVENTTLKQGLKVLHNSSNTISPSVAVDLDTRQTVAFNTDAIYNRVESNGSNAGNVKGIYNFMVGDNSAGTGSIVGSQTTFSSSLTGYGKTLYGSYMSFAGTPGANEYAYYANNGKSYFGGNVGIGTTDPEAALNVQGGKVLIGTANGSLADLTINTDGTQEIFRGRVSGVTNFIINETGNVGMGTQTPTERLDVSGNARFQDSVYVEKMLGVGTTTPSYVLDVQGDAASTAYVSEFRTNYSGTSDIRAINAVSVPADGYGYGVRGEGGYRGVYGLGNGGAYTGGVAGVYGIASGTAGTRYGVYGTASGGTTNWAGYFSGNVYVSNRLAVGGTSGGATGYDLSVDGKIICEELKVQASGSWPDYVFADEYTLPTLDEVEDHIEANNHLPGVPSAAVIEAEGINVGEMQKILMEKVEQLTLYMIDANNRIKQLERENTDLKANK